MKNETVKALVKKVPFLLLLYIFGGCFCRWYQLKNELLFDGSLAEGAFMQRVLPLLTLTFLVGFAFILYGLKNNPSHKDCFSRHPIPVMLQILAGGILAAGNTLQLIVGREPASIYTQISIALTKFVPYLGLIAGLCIILFALLTLWGKNPSPLLYMLVSIYLVVQLIVCFQEWNMDPSIHDYAYKLLAAITCMLGCFQIAGLCFRKGNRRITIFWNLCAMFFCSVSLPDYVGDTSELLINISLLVLTLTQGIQLLYAPDPKEEEESSPEDSVLTE